MPSDPIRTPVTEESVDENGDVIIIGYPDDTAEEIELTGPSEPSFGG